MARYAGYSYGDEWKKNLAAGKYRFLLEGFNQKRAYAHRAAELVEPAIRERMAAPGQGGRRAGPPDRRLQSASLDPRRRGRSALDRRDRRP